MPYIPPEVVEKAREMDLLTYLKNYEPQELVHFGGNTYCTREHDSLKISNGKWCWFSRGIGGYSALDYLIKVKEMPFTQAVETIMGNVAVLPPTYSPAPSKPKEKVLLLPKANRCAAHAVEYLHGRGIDYELIDFCISTGRLYESYPHYNAVFVGQDLDGKPRYANLRGIGTDFIGDANGSDKRYSFGISAEAQSDTLNLFESAVDLLSYGTMQKLDGKDWRRENLLSLAGVYKPKAKIEESSLPAALVQYLADYPHIRKAVLRLDNDYTGRIAADTIKTLLSQRYAVKVAIQPPRRARITTIVYVCGSDFPLPSEKKGAKNDEMGDLMNTGMRIRRFRISCGLTQKALGVAVGFPQENADIRIAQYESGTRTPKHELLCRMAQALDITPSALAVPRIRNAEELSSLLSALEDEYGTTFLNEERKQTMKTYAVTITETLQKTVEIEANSKAEAEAMVEARWNDSEYILDADSFVGVDFSARSNERSRDYER